VALVVLVSAVLVAGAVVLFRRSRNLPSGIDTELDRTRARRARRMYAWVNVAQLAAIVAGSRSLALADQTEFIAALVCFVLGLHFLPLARVFRLPPYATMGWAQIVVAAAGALLAIGTGQHWLATAVPAWGAATTLLATGLAMLIGTVPLTSVSTRCSGRLGARRAGYDR
jgi:hypothetical protein